MSMYGIAAEVNELIARRLEDDCDLVEGANVTAPGLDQRALPSKVWVDKNLGFMVIELGDSRQLDYYGGFEYVQETKTIGNYKFYPADNKRVSDFMDAVTGES